MLFCGFSSLASASTFHATVLDPTTVCTDPTTCFVGDTSPFAVNLTSAECTLLALPDGADDGCFLGVNSTGETITSLTVTFPNAMNLGTLTCDNADNPPGLPPTIFTNPTCDSAPPYTLSFSGGGLAPDGDFIIFEDGADPGLLGTGVGTVGVTPEPDSLLLLSTGALGGLCAFWRRRFGFGTGRI
jgi:hypothetical protein